MVFRNTKFSQDFFFFSFRVLLSTPVVAFDKCLTKIIWIFQILCPKKIWRFFVLIWHCPFFYKKRRLSKKVILSLYQSLGLVQNFVEITQGSITSEPFDEEIETSITIRRVRSGLLTLEPHYLCWSTSSHITTNNFNNPTDISK